MNWQTTDIEDAMATMKPGESVMFNCKGMDGYWQAVRLEWKKENAETDFSLEVHYGDWVSLVLSRDGHSPAPPVVEEKIVEIEVNATEEDTPDPLLKKPWWGNNQWNSD